MDEENYRDSFDAMATEHHLEHHRREEEMQKIIAQLKEKMTNDEPNADPNDQIVINEIHQLAIGYLAPLTKQIDPHQVREFNALHTFGFMVFLHLQRKGIIKVIYDPNRKPSCSCGETPCTCPFQTGSQKNSNHQETFGEMR